MPDPALRAADILAQRLYDAGCRYAFGMPGGEVLTLVDALEKAGIQFILAKHENAAGFMAEGVHHRDGAPAILVATLGPGVLNGVNVIANAWQDRVPLIILTGCVDGAEALSYTHQVLDHQAVLRPITKASLRMAPTDVDVLADKALALATQARQGPVHIDVPISVADAPVTHPLGRRRGARAVVAPYGKDLAKARAWLEASQRPLAVVGLDVLTDGSATILRAFVEHFQIPFITTYKAKGVLSEDHPLCLGAAGLSPLADSHLLPMVDACDLVLAIGYDPIEMRPGWRRAWDPAKKPVIDICAEPNSHDMHYATLEIVADTGATLEALAQQAKVTPVWSDEDASASSQATPKSTQRALQAAFPTDDVWGPAAVIAETRDVLPKGTLATADSGAHRILLSQMWRCDEPKGLVQSSGLCTMGCAVPLAMGTALAAPERVVVSFSGDAGFLMVAGELATAAELGVKPIFVVFVDSSLALIELKQRQRQMTNAGVDFGHHDFGALGRALGGQGVRVTSRQELRAALEAAIEAETFTVIAAEIERTAYDGRI